MNKHLNIPAQIQALITDIEATPLHLAELPMTEHPKLPQFNRFIRVYDIDAKSRLEFVFFVYEQILKDKETGEVINIQLSKPEWVVDKTTWSYLRNEQNQPITATIKEGSEETDNKIKVPSYKYMIWLMKNNKAGLLQLIQGYLASFIQAKQTELDAL